LGREETVSMGKIEVLLEETTIDARQAKSEIPKMLPSSSICLADLKFLLFEPCLKDLETQKLPR
jgi:uncharacterized protein YwgA